jgi:hypothetical protein
MSAALLTAVLIALAVPFAASACHKAELLFTRRAHVDPVVASWPPAGRRPRAAVGASLIAEAAALVALAVRPVAGTAALVLLLIAYTWLLRSLPPHQGCDCFGRLARTRDRAGAIRRNFALLAVAAGALVAEELGAGTAAVSTTTLSLAALLLAPPIALATLQALTEPKGTQADVSRI